jgi:3-oxoacyl-[acyl-carrier-protein] synthase-3
MSASFAGSSVPQCHPKTESGSACSYATIPAHIGAFGSYLPEQIVTNHELPGLEKTNGAIERLLGAVERRKAAEGQSCSDMIAIAAKQILERSDISPLDLDRIIVSATPGDFIEPNTASVVQHKIGARCKSIDIGMSCVGWVAGLDYGLRCIATGEQNVLVLAGTIISRGSHFHNPMHRAIFGDGAGGALLSASSSDDDCRFLAGNVWSDGDYFDMICMPNQGTVRPETIPGEFEGSFYMGDRRVINQALRENLSYMLESTLETAGVTKEDIDVCFIHQPSKPLFEEAFKACDMPREKVIEDYDRYGNTISAELPISMDENVQNGRIKRGDLVLKVTFGAGFSGGMMLYRY